MILVRNGKPQMKCSHIARFIVFFLLGSFLSIATADETYPWGKTYELEASGKYKQAAAVIEPFLDAGGDAEEYARMRYGWLNYLMRNYNDSIRSYQKAIHRNPESLQARYGITLPLLAQERWKEAARYANEVLKRSPWDFTAHERLLVSEEGLKKWGVMKKHASGLAARYPASFVPWVYLARAEIWLGDHDAAKRAYQRVIRRLPAHVEANAYLNNGKSR